MSAAPQVESYVMNPAEDTVLFGDELREGMWVLPQGDDMRNRHGRSEEGRIRAQRFMQVTKLRVKESPLGALSVFIGRWVDGYQHAYQINTMFAWIVKKDSIPDETGTVSS